MDPETSVDVLVSKVEVLAPTQNRAKKLWKLATQTRWAILTILLAAAASGGSFYVALHPELIWEAMNYPYAILFLAAVPATIFGIGLVINFSTAIQRFLKIQLDRIKEDKRSLGFEIAIGCFITVSMAESGTFFGSSIHNLLFGYFTVLTIDVCAVIFMNSRKIALMHGNEKEAFWYMIGVAVTAIPSAFANAYSSLLNFNLSKDATHIPLWMGQTAPYVGVIFPMLIVFLAFTVDATVNNKTVVQKYEDQQDVKIKLLEAQERALTKQYEVQARLASLAQKRSLLHSIFFTKNKLQLVSDLVTARLEQKVTDIVAVRLDAAAITTQLNDQSTALATLKQDMYQLPERVLNQQKTLEHKIQEFDDQITRLDTLIEELLQMRETVPSLIEARIQELQPEMVAERVFLKMIPSVKEDVQKQITAAIPQTIITEVKTPETKTPEVWDVAKVRAKQVGFTMKNPIATIQEFTFTTFEEAATWMEDPRITPESIRKAYDEHLVPSKYFRIVITEAFGKQGEHPVILLHAGVKKLLLKIK